MSVEIIGKPIQLADGTKMPFPPATRANGFIFVSGTIGTDEDMKVVEGGIEAQTTRCLQNIAAALKPAGATLQDIAKCQVWLTDFADFPGMNQAYKEAFGDHTPARSTVLSPLVLPGALVEIEAIAVDPGQF